LSVWYCNSIFLRTQLLVHRQGRTINHIDHTDIYDD
jgi:hypothetical protein